MSDHIPPEIIKLILLRLPVKPLLRFRCVSKPWRTLIDSKPFTKHHLHHSAQTTSNRTLLVNSRKLFYVDFDSFHRLDFGDTGLNPNCISGHCNGLVLLVFAYNNVVLWNPATRKLNRLPYEPLDDIESDDIHAQERFALGYGSTRDDYKVVRVIQVSAYADGGRFSTVAAIYSLKSSSNSWKRIKGFPYMLHPRITWGMHLNGGLHTVVRDDRVSGSEPRIMGFDVVKEEHYEVPKPKLSGGHRRLESVEVMGGFLAAVVSAKRNCSEVWVMKEYGVKDSWTKLLRFVPPDSKPCVNLCPLAYSKSGDEVLLNYDGMCLNWYDLKNKKVKIAWIDGMTPSFGATHGEPIFHAQVCVSSLVSPFGVQAKNGKETKKKRDDFLATGFKLKL